MYIPQGQTFHFLIDKCNVWSCKYIFYLRVHMHIFDMTSMNDQTQGMNKNVKSILKEIKAFVEQHVSLLHTQLSFLLHTLITFVLIL